MSPDRLGCFPGTNQQGPASLAPYLLAQQPGPQKANCANEAHRTSTKAVINTLFARVSLNASSWKSVLQPLEPTVFGQSWFASTWLTWRCPPSPPPGGPAWESAFLVDLLPPPQPKPVLPVMFYSEGVDPQKPVWHMSRGTCWQLLPPNSGDCSRDGWLCPAPQPESSEALG